MLPSIKNKYGYEADLDSMSISTTNVLNPSLKEQSPYCNLKQKEIILLFIIYLPA